MKLTTNFNYKPTRDIFGLVFGLIGYIIGFVIMNTLFLALVAGDPSFATLAKWSTIAYLGVSVSFVLSDIVNIFVRTHNCLTISDDEIVYKTGWLSKTETTIPAHKIRSCSKSSGWLQRLCGSMDISVTTAGDSDEISFYNIANGDDAYRQISELAKSNREL